MIRAKVVAKVWPDKQIPSLEGRRLVAVRDVASGAEFVAVDLLSAGLGDVVLVATDESAAAASGEATVDAAVVALVADAERESAE